VAQFVRKIVLLCDRHDVAWGTPESLAGFMRTLKENSHLAMDFWSVVALMSEDGSTVGPEVNRLLAVIVEGVTGRTVAEVRAAGQGPRQAVSELVSLLAGEDIWSPVRKGVKRAEKLPIEDRGGWRGAAAKTDRRVEESAEARAEVRRGEASKDVDAAEIGRLQSNPAESDPLPIPPPVVRDSSVSEARSRYREPSAADEVHRRLVLEPEPVGGAAKFVSGEGEPLSAAADSPVREEVVLVNDPLIRIPLAEYAERNGSRKGMVAGAVLLLILGVAACGVLMTRGYGLALREGFETVVQSVRGRVMGGGSARNGEANSSVVGGQVDGAGSAAAANDGEGRVASAPAPAAEGSGTNAGGAAASGEAPRTEARAEDGVSREETAAGARQRAVEERTAEGGGLVQVPAEVMTSHLISSRVPVYPEEARVRHAEGQVVMQAVVTKDGAVGHVHVLTGDTSLRAAAASAVATWRYRPYMLNGEPVDVSTTISVEFPAEW
jgi:TonB family protein